MGNSLKKKNHTLDGLLPNSNTIFGQHLIVGDAAGDVVLFASPWGAWGGVSERHVWMATLGGGQDVQLSDDNNPHQP